MSSCTPSGRADDRSNVVGLDDGYAQSLLDDLRAMRRRFIEAWQERGLTLTREERAALRAEISDTCSLLTNLTATD